MKLFEFEGHKILNAAGVKSPFFVVAKNVEEAKAARVKFKFPIACKVQVLSGGRGKLGGVKLVRSEAQLVDFANEFLGKSFKGDKVQYIVLAETVDIEHEYYISITYDTVSRLPYIMFCEQGGVEIEGVAKQNPEEIVKISFDPITGPTAKQVSKLGISPELILNLWKAFESADARLVEINPLVKTEGGDFLALDAKVILDDNGLARHEDLDVLPKGAVSAVPSKLELAAHKIDSGDYRGSAGTSFIELGGDIAIMASGGGASLLVMDSVAAAGGEPANYTEYSGNPSREKVAKLTEVVLSQKNLSACLVAGAFANFTDIYETLGGFMDTVVKVKPKYPIVIRRGGPRQPEAYEMVRTLASKNGLDIHLFGPETPISVACKKAVELAREYKNKDNKK